MAVTKTATTKTTPRIEVLPGTKRRLLHKAVRKAVPGEILYETPDYAIATIEVPTDSEQHKWRPFSYALVNRQSGVVEAIADSLTLAMQAAYMSQAILDQLAAGDKAEALKPPPFVPGGGSGDEGPRLN